jgi:selenocysteine lyase/cysteine desulfurase
MISLVGAAAAMKMLLGIGIESIEGRVLKLTGRLIDGIKDLGLELRSPEESQRRSGIVNFKIDRPQEVVQKLKNKGIVPCGSRADWVKCSPIFHSTIRVAPHFYNTEKEIDKFVEELKNC